MREGGPAARVALRAQAAARFSRSLKHMPKISIMQEPNPKPDSGAGWLTFALAIGAAAAYLLLWSLLGGTDGCGPPGHSASGRISEATPLVLPFAAAGLLFAFGAKRCWRVSTLAWGTITIIVTSGLLEVLIFLIELGAHHCTE
jgi:hypothetical protein